MRTTEQGFQSITVVKDDLLATLMMNREAHREQFETAMTGYRDKVEIELATRLTLVQSGKPFELYIDLEAPEDHTEDYDRVIAMLRWDKDETVMVTEKQFRNYVQNKWSWTSKVSLSNAFYSRVN